jgi:hypothetical protein
VDLSLALVVFVELKSERSESEEKPEKLSMRQVLKRKQQELSSTPEKGFTLADDFRSPLSNSALGNTSAIPGTLSAMAILTPLICLDCWKKLLSISELVLML